MVKKVDVRSAISAPKISHVISVCINIDIAGKKPVQALLFLNILDATKEHYTNCKGQ